MERNVQNAQVVSAAWSYDCERGNGSIAEVGVVPRLRGQGIGGKLTVKALQRLKERGFEQVFLGVDKQNTPAIALYEKLGFQKLDWQILELERSLR